MNDGRTMQAVQIREPGGPEVLEMAVRPIPEPAAGEVLIKVAAAGVNGPDLMQRRGLYPAPAGASDLPGLEISGVVAACGAGVQRWKTGDEVLALTNGGGYAQYCTADERQCLPIPRGVDIVDAAGLAETYFTVWSNLFLEGGLKAGQTLLVHGGAGGIGTTAIQLAKAFGVSVVATDSPEQRCKICADLGADRVVDYKQEDFVEVVREMGGADMILDIVGGPNVEANFKAAKHGGRIVQIAFAAGSKVTVNLMPVMLKRLVYTGSTLRTRPPEFKARVAQELLRNVWPKIEAGDIRVVTSRRFALDDAGKAHATMEESSHTGKVLLVVGEACADK